jgi:alkanesulfonate monooxygenase SsuD/methylene tetrahydromethanopterin reductase-like flavin-dependent oxidoreductase (luciferase family)
VISLPYHHPLMVADRIVQLDYQTRGRAMFGFGPGLLPSDAMMLGIDPDTHDLSVSHDRIGDVQRAQGDLTAALTSYQASLAIAERLAKADPGNAGWQATWR